MRGGMLLLGIGLGILWLAGLYGQGAAWLTWLVFAAGVLSIIGALLPDSAETGIRAAPFVVAAGLFVLWIVALSMGVQSWFAWWTFAFGVGYVILGAFASRMGTHEPTVTTTTGPRTV